jgi:two-component sensor histidine kinase
VPKGAKPCAIVHLVAIPPGYVISTGEGGPPVDRNGYGSGGSAARQQKGHGYTVMTGWKRRLTVTQRLLALIAVALLPTLAALLYLNLSIYRSQLNEVHETALRTSELASLEMKRIVTGAEGTLLALARAQIVRTFAPPECGDYLSDVVSELPQFQAIIAIDADGRVRCSSSPDTLRTDAPAPPTLNGRSAGKGLSIGTYARSPEQPSVAILPLILPIHRGQEIVGSLAAELDLDWLGAEIRGRDFPEGASLTIADRDGVIIAREPQSDRFVGTRIPEAFQSLVHAEAPGSMELVSQDGTKRVIGFFPPATTGIGLYISAGLSTDAALASARAAAYWSLWLAAAGTLAAFVLAWAAGTRLFRDPIRQLVRTVEAWRRGDDTARTGIGFGGSELSILAHAIDSYMDDLVTGRSARQAAEESRDLLLHEMEHRVKNTHATVQAVVRQTLKGRVEPEILHDLEGRLSAMDDAHRMLLSDSWQSADLRTVVNAALAPFGIDESRLSVDGPSLRITPRATLALTMVLHELGTNALKYGALRHGDGRIEISWRVEVRGRSGRFHFGWIERDGPPISPPESSGFGTRLIQAALSSEFGAEVTLSYPTTGVRLTFEADAERFLVATGEEAA